jgi:hypothetical protein
VLLDVEVVLELDYVLTFIESGGITPRVLNCISR